MTEPLPRQPLPLAWLLRKRLLFEAGRLSPEDYSDCLQTTVDRLAQVTVEVMPSLRRYCNSGTKLQLRKRQVDEALTSAMRALRSGNRHKVWKQLQRAERSRLELERLAQCSYRRDELELQLDSGVSELNLFRFESYPTLWSIRRALSETAPNLISNAESALANALLSQVGAHCASLFDTSARSLETVIESTSKTDTEGDVALRTCNPMLAARLASDRRTQAALASSGPQSTELIERAERLARSARRLLVELDGSNTNPSEERQ